MSHIYGTPKATSPKEKIAHLKPKIGNYDANICNIGKGKTITQSIP